MKRTRPWKAKMKNTNSKKKTREKSLERKNSLNEEDFKVKPMTI